MSEMDYQGKPPAISQSCQMFKTPMLVPSFLNTKHISINKAKVGAKDYKEPG